jgi:ATP-dependent exoDNAse (exonuclease V) alpha subunit
LATLNEVISGGMNGWVLEADLKNFVGAAAALSVRFMVFRLISALLDRPRPDVLVAKALFGLGVAATLAASQVAAVRLALMSKVTVMTGGPGVGKTTIVKAILRILAAKGTEILLYAPTGRAAKRMTEATGLEAKTIHRLLEVDPKSGCFKRAATTTRSTVICW